MEKELNYILRGLVSDPVGVNMYVEVGKLSTGLVIYRCLRGTSYNRAAAF